MQQTNPKPSDGLLQLPLSTASHGARHTITRVPRSVARRLTRFLSACGFFVYNSLITHCPGYTFRKSYLKLILRYSVGTGTAVHMGCFFTGGIIRIGRNSVINRRCYLDGRGSLEIGDNVSVSPEVYILTASHVVDDPKFAGELKPVVIEEYCWIGARAIILPGIKLGRGTVVGAGSVVTKSTDPYSVVVGNPARKIRERNPELDYQLRYFPWFDTDIGTS